MKWQKKKGTSGEMTPKEEIPGGGVAESFQTREEQWVTSYPVSFQWSPAVLGFGDQQVILQIYDDYNAEAPLIKVIVTGSRTKTFTISLSRGGKVGVRCKSDSSVVVDIPILAYSKEFFWQYDCPKVPLAVKVELLFGENDQITSFIKTISVPVAG